MSIIRKIALNFITKNKTKIGGEFEVNDGKSDFELWRSIKGNEAKTVEDYFKSLKGKKGLDIIGVKLTVENKEDK